MEQEEIVPEDPLFIENDRLYVPIRFVAKYMQADLSWDQESKQVRLLTAEGDEIVFQLNSREIQFNGEHYWMDAEPLFRNDRTYLPARHVAELLHTKVVWSGEPRSVHFEKVPLYEVQTGESLQDISDKVNVPVEVLSVRNDISEEELDEGAQLKVVVPKILSEQPPADMVDLLARIIHAEAGYESFEGQLAVGNVIMNRVNSDKFPNTLKEVIYQPGQFTPAMNGSLEKVIPNDSSIEAAVRVLQGEAVIHKALYFFNPRDRKSVV